MNDKKKVSNSTEKFLMYFGSGCLPFGETTVLEYLRPGMHAIFKTEQILDEKGHVIGIMFNIKKPTNVKVGYFDEYSPDYVEVINLGEIDPGEYDIRLDLHPGALSSFGLHEEDVNAINCELEGDWLKLYLADTEMSPPPPPGKDFLIDGKLLFPPSIFSSSE